jgi:hypothetical protein
MLQRVLGNRTGADLHHGTPALAPTAVDVTIRPRFYTNTDIERR